MPYIGKEPEHGNYQLLDALTAPSGVFDGSRTVFNLTADGVAVYPTSPTTLIISLGGVLQEPNSSYTVSGNQITFTTAPATSTTFFGVSLGDTLDIGTPSDDSVDSQHYVDGSIDSAHIADDAVTYAKMQNLGTADRVLGSESTGVIGEVQIVPDMIASNAVTTAKILDANVTLAKVANQAANTVLVRDANSSGVISAKAVADTQILIGDGTGFTAAALSGEATMTNAGVVSITDNIIDEANLKISNSPTNGQFLSAQSGNTGGLTWAAAGGGDQTPWTADVDAANYELDNVGNAESSWTNGVLYIARTAAPRIELEGHGADENPILMRFNKSRHASLGGHTALASGDEIMQILARGSNGSSFLNGAIITAATTEAWSGSARGTKLEFSTTANTTTSTGVKMKIDHDGEVSVYQGGDRVSVQGGLAKAFCRFYNTTIDSNWNVSSITDHNPGDWTVNMTNGMATADDHSVVAVPKSGDPTTNAVICRPNNDAFTTTTVRLTGINIDGASRDPSGGSYIGICAVIYGVF